MTKSDEIRKLASEGYTTADIARSMNIRYQHVYNVLKQNGQSSGKMTRRPLAPLQKTEKPSLNEVFLVAAGFKRIASWVLTPDGDIALGTNLPKEQGVYAFCVDGVVQYVGVATMGLAKRIYFYGKPGISQRTSLRLNGVIKGFLAQSVAVDVLVAMPPDLVWNGLPIHGCAGLELGLIKTYHLPWNQRSSG